MRKIGLALMVVVLLAGSAFASPMHLTMATGGVAGTYFPLGGVMAQVISERSGVVNITAQATGASVENVNLVDMGEADLALVQNDIAYFAFTGSGIPSFEGNQITNFRAIANLYPEVLHVVAQADLGVESMADLLGKRIAVGAPGSGNEANCRQIFGFYGLSYTNTSPFFISFAESVNHFKDRLIDSFVFTTGAPNPGIMDIVTLHEVTFVPIDGEIRDQIIEQYPYFTKAVIPAGTYMGQTEDVETIAVQAILIVREDLSDDIVYAMTRAMFENLDDIALGHAMGRMIQLETALDGLTVPLHPGAERFYRAVGLIN